MENTQESCNGYTNWETWNLNLWAMNDEFCYNVIMGAKPFTAFTAKNMAISLFPDGTPDMPSHRTLYTVNYEEIADYWNEV